MSVTPDRSKDKTPVLDKIAAVGVSALVALGMLRIMNVSIEDASKTIMAIGFALIAGIIVYDGLGLNRLQNRIRKVRTRTRD